MSLVSRRHFLTGFAAACLAGPRISYAADATKLEIVIDGGGWGQVSTRDIRAVLLSTAGEVWPYCAGEQIKPIRVYHRNDFPQTDFLHDWRGRVRIGLHTSDTHWAQMSFQFGHEFCHALAQHTSIALRGWHPPKHANLWFEECLCETSSLFVLRRLALSWQQQSQSEAWRNFAPAMAKYAADRMSLPEHQLPAGTSFADWFRENEASMRENAALREKNVIVARQMLPIFESEPSGWDAVCYLNLGAHLPGKPLAQHLAEWQTNSPASARPFVGKIVALFPATAAARPSTPPAS
jgi:hypothetical protein